MILIPEMATAISEDAPLKDKDKFFKESGVYKTMLAQPYVVGATRIPKLDITDFNFREADERESSLIIYLQKLLNID